MNKIPLAELMRPQTLEETSGQSHLISSQGFLTHLIEAKKPLSLLLWGPPGCGKTTLAKLYANSLDAHFYPISPLMHGISDLKALIEKQRQSPLLSQRLIIFVDEIHRFNKAQQDIFLPYLENGTLILIGATTENPSFALNKALISRLRVLQLHPLSDDELEKVLLRYESKVRSLHLTLEARVLLIRMAQGDARHLLNLIENIEHDLGEITPQKLELLAQQRPALYDAHADTHYQLISALHKAVRGSDPDASLYWLSRMLEGGESPLYLARRITRMAIEDVGLADPEALSRCLHAWETYEKLGSPEGDLALAEAIVYLALAPKSNAIYTAFKQARALAKETSHFPPPPWIINAPTSLMKDLGYGKGYVYDHDADDSFSGQNYFPPGMERVSFYHPRLRGFEREMKKRADYFQKLREQKAEEEKL
ncbi:replication-associated recombination protein A [Rhabdochlamydiaceae symbiont of Dictyostelium giganteum]|uniref:replication-associated recombination protein A n=1 Tax=Rhabdochlamydiaceae symbiont of Dictyostelium giganteum TaxID=3342349 RepID=UPI00384DAFF7